VTCFTFDLRNVRDIASASGWYRTSTARETGISIMFSKTIIAALIVASAAISFATKASAGPGAQQAPTGSESYYMNRASQNHDNGGN
jgi:hypothetical protein